MASLDSFKCRKTLSVGAKAYEIYSLKAAERNGLAGVSQLPFSLKIVLENLLRNEDGRSVRKEDIEAVAAWIGNRGKTEHEIAFRPARVLMQDFTGVPAVVDLAAMRDAMVALGGDPDKINPLVPVDLVIDHSVIVDHFGTPRAFAQNVAREYEQNQERYRFLKWGQQAFSNFSVVPPGTGICHQVNLEYLAQTVWTAKEKRNRKTVETAFFDTLVGTDSHTTMVNGLAALGWGVGGIEAEAAMLGQPLSMLLPEVIGFKLEGELREGVTATDLVLTVTEMLRKKGVVGKFVEFYGAGLTSMTVADRATLGNMAPEYGATCGLFPIDAQTLAYLKTTSRKPSRLALVEAYAKAQGAFRTRLTPDPLYSDTLALNLGEVTASLAGPKRPQDRIVLSGAKAGFGAAMTSEFRQGDAIAERHKVEGTNFDLGHGDVVIAAITSCTNTSNPNVMMAAGLLARNAVARGLTVKPWVKTSLAPGSQVVEDYLKEADLQSRSTSSASISSALAAPPASAIPARSRPRFQRRSPGTIWSRPRCSPATAISRGASIPTCAPTTWPPRRWSSLTRSPARCRSISPASRSVSTGRASPSISPTSGPRRRRSSTMSRPSSTPGCSSQSTRACSTATPTGAR